MSNESFDRTPPRKNQNMKISYALCTHDEEEYIPDLLKRLTDFVEQFKTIDPSVEYEIVILDDNSKGPKTAMAIRAYSQKFPYIKVSFRKHTGNFAEHKNHLINLCTGDWIVNLDADEWLDSHFMALLPSIIDSNPLVEAYWVPRINTVDGLTQKHIQKWQWVITKMEGFTKVKEINKNSDEYKLLKLYDMIIHEEEPFVTYYEPIVAWPDPQMRIFKNSPDIRWKNKVHEQLTGYKNFTSLPFAADYAIRHFKDIKRQESQNEFYDKINQY